MKSLLAPGVYAVATTVPHYMRGTITAGRHYPVLSLQEDGFFAIKDNRGSPMPCSWDRCHLLDGQAWRKIVIDKVGVESTHGRATGICRDQNIQIRVLPSTKVKAKARSRSLGVSMAQYITDLIEQD